MWHCWRGEKIEFSHCCASIMGQIYKCTIWMSSRSCKLNHYTHTHSHFYAHLSQQTNQTFNRVDLLFYDGIQIASIYIPQFRIFSYDHKMCFAFNGLVAQWPIESLLSVVWTINIKIIANFIVHVKITVFLFSCRSVDCFNAILCD